MKYRIHWFDGYSLHYRHGFDSWEDAASYAHNILGFGTSREFDITSYTEEY